jgi:cysteine desulfurase/selenocysteine lyase
MSTYDPSAFADITKNPARGDFPLLANNPELAFLDSAATAQRPAVVLDAQRRFYETMNANPLRGLYRLSVEATQAIEDAREHVARHIGGGSGSQVVFTRNASESLNICAKSFGASVLRPGDQVVITIMEHHSNLIPWQQVCRETGAELVYLRPEKDGTVTDEAIEAAIGPRTRIVSVTQVSNVLGVEVPVARIAARAHQEGATVIVDACQSVPHMAVDASKLGCDLMAFSAHKMGGPMGIGVLWGKKEVLDEMPPFLTGGEMIDSVTETDAVWAPVPQKFEAGTQDAAGIYAFDADLTYLEGIGKDAIEARERALAARLCERLEATPHIQVFGPVEPERHVGSVAFNVEGIHPHDVASLLDMKDVAIRAGHHCAQPLLAWLGTPSTCRASVAFYNDADDIEKLVDGLGFVWRTFHHER